ncbi:MAG: hypothetical protein BJ554DRAFT_2220 [Olpidium bornovanus]|uniref:Uncharacterized protein n=1 Tax=Olpidium bornovanus TaxID=278681 RepID=A0A8H7ZR70_9FUNG|nr:MAG: hypothetical protein BJ554DRAFT_2220 [Olpidium bornovanus]
MLETLSTSLRGYLHPVAGAAKKVPGDRGQPSLPGTKHRGIHLPALATGHLPQNLPPDSTDGSTRTGPGVAKRAHPRPAT